MEPELFWQCQNGIELKEKGIKRGRKSSYEIRK